MLLCMESGISYYYEYVIIYKHLSATTADVKLSILIDFDFQHLPRDLSCFNLHLARLI